MYKPILRFSIKRADLLYSFCIALCIFVLSYFLNNQPLFIGENLEQYAWMEWIKSKMTKAEKADSFQPLYINVAYDKQLVEHFDKYNMPIGNRDITDRQKLLKLLQMLHSTEQYKYIFLDVRFEKGYKTEYDSALFAEINSMDRIVVANHQDIELSDTMLASKAAINDYSATITTSFARYKYFYQDKPSMPLFAYSELTGKTIDRHGLLYTCDGKLCYNSLFLLFPVESFEEEYKENDNGDGMQADKLYYHLGADILSFYNTDIFATLTNNKYVVIGDFVNDIHDTYTGEKPGPVITFYAFCALMRGKHFVSFWVMLFLFIIYFFISLFLFYRYAWIETCKHRIWIFLLSLIGYSVILFVTSILLNAIWNIPTNFLIPSICFAIQDLIINYKHTSFSKV